MPSLWIGLNPMSLGLCTIVVGAAGFLAIGVGLPVGHRKFPLGGL